MCNLFHYAGLNFLDLRQKTDHNDIIMSNLKRVCYSEGLGSKRASSWFRSARIR